MLTSNLKKFQKPIEFGDYEYLDYKTFYQRSLYFGAAVDYLLRDKVEDNYFFTKGKSFSTNFLFLSSKNVFSS